MALCTYDEAYTIPTEKAALIGLRTMQILAEEMGLCDTVDPLAGSYYIERLTTDLEKKIVEEIERVERMGGIVKAISEGLIQREVAGQAYRYEQGIQSGEIVKVGVNSYRIEEEERDVELHEYRPEQAEEKIRRLNELRSQRDTAAVTEALGRLRQAAQGPENLMPQIMEAVRVYATVGEMTQVLKDVFGEFKEPVAL
jgi:methylmalonyl-CoA mutase N-terminal domain/subunit